MTCRTWLHIYRHLAGMANESAVEPTSNLNVRTCGQQPCQYANVTVAQSLEFAAQFGEKPAPDHKSIYSAEPLSGALGAGGVVASPKQNDNGYADQRLH